MHDHSHEENSVSLTTDGSQKAAKSKYWSSLAQYNNDPEFLEKSHKEFLSSPLQESAGLDETSTDGFNRRDFMKLMAASTALASSACFQKPMHKILPYVNQPEEVTFGVANYYASTCGECGSSCGTLVKTREGRPIKIEGNPDHPMNRGGLCARGQASILNLYDPDRLRNPVALTRGSDVQTYIPWRGVDKKITDHLTGVKATGRVRILSGTVNSPTTLKLIGEFLKGFSNSKHVVYDPISAEYVAAAHELSYGTRLVPRYRVDKADVIVAIDSDFLGTWLSPVEFTKQFSSRRKLNKKENKFSKLIAFESVMTLTGSNADVRVGIRPEDGAAVALSLAHELVASKKASVDGETSEFLNQYSAHSVADKLGIPMKSLVDAAGELWAARGRSLVMAGSAQSQNENGLALQLAVNLLNSLLQNDGVTVDYSGASLQSQGSYANLLQLIKDMNAGEVDTLFIYNSNPAYSLPKSLGFTEATKKVALVVSFSDRVDETAKLADYVCPNNHALESWGDAEPQKGLYSLVQPTIRPIYDTRSFQDSLLTYQHVMSGDNAGSSPTDFHEYLQNHWRDSIFKDSGASNFVMFWEAALRDGVFDSRAHQGKSSGGAVRSVKAGVLKAHAPTLSSGDGFSLALYEQIAQGDGSAANNPWLQELPDPISRICWDNYVSVSSADADELHLKDGDLVKFDLNGKTLQLPAHVQPGLHKKVAVVALGYGREAAGSVGTGIGQNSFQWMTLKNDLPVFSGFKTSLKKTGGAYMLASIQEHHTIDDRDVVREASLAEYVKNPRAGNEVEEALTTIWSGHEYKGNRWHMAIDLNSCTGCSACVVGCQSENNIPVVGKDGVARSRIMHWIRIDRYYSGTPDDPKVFHQPMLCQHCENAPCETVCPVIATSHDDEGLNVQTYNRCVGTRYCANNCPYKVRRFNWFEYNYGGQIRYPQTLSQNPEVTVRSRGVMEKCTFCIQRIHDAKNKAKDLGRPVQDNDLQTACQQSCPADAITFGNINNKESAVAELAEDPRGYKALGELNVRPSITYLTKIRNAETT